MNTREALEKVCLRKVKIHPGTWTLDVLAAKVEAALWATVEAMAERRRYDIPEHGERVDMAACVDIGIGRYLTNWQRSRWALMTTKWTRYLGLIICWRISPSSNSLHSRNGKCHH